MAGNVEKQISCLYNMEAFDQMAKSATDAEHQDDGEPSCLLQEGSPLLITIGERLASVGLANDAVQAFLRGNDVKAAIDCCVLLNRWDQAVLLAEEHDLPQIEGLLSKYAQHLLGDGRRMKAIELFRKANRHPEAAKLLSEMAQEEVDAKASLFVLAALEVEKFRDKTLNVVPQGTMATLSTMAGGKGTMAGRGTMAGGRKRDDGDHGYPGRAHAGRCCGVGQQDLGPGVAGSGGYGAAARNAQEALRRL